MDRSTADVDLAAGDTHAAVEAVSASMPQEISGHAGRQAEAEAMVRRFEEEAGVKGVGSREETEVD